jgi:hypothetical protein
MQESVEQGSPAEADTAMEPPANGNLPALAPFSRNTPPNSFKPGAVLEADGSQSEDNASDVGSCSITASILDYEFENGRRYHAYKAGHYPMPNDENELDRLDLQHHIFTLLLNGELFLAPVKPETTERVLDMGTGTGLWAIELADRFPDATVTGVDLSPIQPIWWVQQTMSHSRKLTECAQGSG